MSILESSIAAALNFPALRSDSDVFSTGPSCGLLLHRLGRLGSGDKAEARVDVSRECETRGLEHARPGSVSYTLQCSANHFNLFTKEYMTFRSISFVARVLIIPKVHATSGKIGEPLIVIEGHIDGSAFLYCLKAV